MYKKYLRYSAFLGSIFMAFTFAYEDISVVLEAKKITGDSYYIGGYAGSATEYEGFISNAGFIITKKGVVVFDALGTPALAHAMLMRIRAITKMPIKLVISSHYHADHIYGLQVFKEAGAEIWAPKGALDYFYSDNAKNLLEARRELLFPWVDEKTYLLKPDRIISKDTEFSLGEHSFLINFFGPVHSDGDLSLLIKKDSVLFSGDIIFTGRIPFIGNANVDRWLDILGQIKKRSVDYILPGHGKISSDGAKILSITEDYLNFLLEELTPAVQDFVDFGEVYSQIDWSAFKHLPAFKRVNRRNAYAVYLYLERTLN